METNQPPKQNMDFIDRKIQWGIYAIKEIFVMVQKNVMAFLLTISVSYNIYQNLEMKSIVKELNGKILDAVEKRVDVQMEQKVLPTVRQETEKWGSEIKDTIESNTDQIKGYFKKLTK